MITITFAWWQLIVFSVVLTVVSNVCTERGEWCAEKLKAWYKRRRWSRAVASPKQKSVGLVDMERHIVHENARPKGEPPLKRKR